MQFSFPPVTGIAAFVWVNATRTLTGMGSSTLNLQTSGNQTLPATGTISFNLGATVAGMQSVGLKAGAAGTCVANFSDGTNLFQLLSVAASGNGGVPAMAVTSQMFLQLKNNDAANSATYTYQGWLLAQ